MTPAERAHYKRAIQPKHPDVMHKPVLRTYGKNVVVRDDLLFGGTKMRWVYDVCRENPEVREWCFAGPAWGGASIATTSVCFDLGLRCTQFYAWRKELCQRQLVCDRLGARLVHIKPGYLTNVRAKARKDVAERSDARLIDWGVPGSMGAIERIARQIPTEGLSEVWCAYGSGTLLEALYNIFKPKGLRICVVVVGAPITDKNRALADVVVEYPKPFKWRYPGFVPYPSCRHYILITNIIINYSNDYTPTVLQYFITII